VNTNSGEEAEHLRQWGAKILHHATEKKGCIELTIQPLWNYLRKEN